MVHPLGVERAEMILRQVRRAAAQRSAVHRAVGWPVDRWTMRRIRIAKILRRDPALTGKEVLGRLDADPSVRLRWVWQVMSEYHWAVRRPSGRVQRQGRRFHPLWRKA
jgi:hypothetical protein